RSPGISRPPQTDGKQNVVVRIGWHDKTPAQRACPLSPCQEHRRWIVDHRALKCRDTRLVGGVIARMTDGIEGGVYPCTAVVPEIVRRSGMPEQIGAGKVGPLLRVHDDRIEITATAYHPCHILFER